MLFFLKFLLIGMMVQNPLGPEVIYPRSGDILQGIVQIMGTGDALGFSSYEISFSYPDNPTDTWFIIIDSKKPVQNGILAEWNTSEISDGIYTLRLRVNLSDSNFLDLYLPNLTVNNYSFIERITPSPDAFIQTPTLFYSPTLVPVATFTPLPQNSVILSSRDIIISFILGVLIIFFVFPLFFLIRNIRRK